MAYTSNTFDLSAQGGSVLDRIGRWFVKCGHAVFVSRGMEARMTQMHQLQAKSDAELAKMGLKRDDIPRHVFKDIIQL